MDDAHFLQVAEIVLNERFDDFHALHKYIVACSLYGALEEQYDLPIFIVYTKAEEHATPLEEKLFEQIFALRAERSMIVPTSLLGLFKQIALDAKDERPLVFLLFNRFEDEIRCAKCKYVPVSFDQMAESLSRRISDRKSFTMVNDSFNQFADFVQMGTGKTTIEKFGGLFPELELEKELETIFGCPIGEIDLVIFEEMLPVEISGLVIGMDEWVGFAASSPCRILAAFEYIFESAISLAERNDFVDLLSFTAYRLIEQMFSNKRKLDFISSRTLIEFCIGDQPNLETALTNLYGNKYDTYLMEHPPRRLFSLDGPINRGISRFLRYFCELSGDSEEKYERIGNEILFCFFSRVNQQEIIKHNGWIPYPPTQISVVDHGTGVILPRKYVQFSKCGAPLTEFIHCVSPTFMGMYGDSGVEDGIEELILYGKERRIQVLDLEADAI